MPAIPVRPELSISKGTHLFPRSVEIVNGHPEISDELQPSETSYKMLSVSVFAVAGGLVLTPSMPVQMRRGCSVVMQQGPGYKSTGPQAVSAKYNSNGMNTADPQEPTSLRPENPDLAAAAASKEGIEGKPLAAPPVPIVDQLFVGSGVLAGDVGFDPLQLADTSKALAWYREAEIKHCRLASA